MPSDCSSATLRENRTSRRRFFCYSRDCVKDDQRLHSVFPNSHTQNGVQVANVSDTTRSSFAIEVTPESPRARSVLTGCGGFRTEETLAYDYRTSFQWTNGGVLDTKRHYGSATGRGEWSFGT